MKEPGPQLGFGNIPQSLPKNRIQRSRSQFLVQWNSEGLSLAIGENSPQLCVASASTQYTKPESAEDSQKIAARQLL